MKENKELIKTPEEELVDSFFAHHPVSIADKGFTQATLTRIPHESGQLIGRIWTSLCWLAGIVWLLVSVNIKEVEVTLPTIFHSVVRQFCMLSHNYDTLLLLWAGGVTIACVLAYNIVLTEEEI